MGTHPPRGDVGTHPRFDILGDIPLENAIFTGNLLNIRQNVQIFHYFQTKMATSEEKSEFGVGGLDSPESVTPPPLSSRDPCPSRNFVATPLAATQISLIL